MIENRLEEFRLEIDSCDKQIVELLAKRFEIVKQIGKLKKENNIPVIDSNRFQQVLEKVENIAFMLGISKDTIKDIYNVIHKHSCELEK